MTEMVQVAVAREVAEAEELQEILRTAGIASRLEPAVEVEGALQQKVLVPAASLEAAQDAIEAMTEPDDIVADA